MSKSTDREERRLKQLEALVQEFPDSTPDRLATLLHRHEKGKTGPVMKRVDRVLRKAGLE